MQLILYEEPELRVYNAFFPKNTISIPADYTNSGICKDLRTPNWIAFNVHLLDTAILCDNVAYIYPTTQRSQSNLPVGLVRIRLSGESFQMQHDDITDLLNSIYPSESTSKRLLSIQGLPLPGSQDIEWLTSTNHKSINSDFNPSRFSKIRQNTTGFTIEDMYDSPNVRQARLYIVNSYYILIYTDPAMIEDEACEIYSSIGISFKAMFSNNSMGSCQLGAVDSVGQRWGGRIVGIRANSIFEYVPDPLAIFERQIPSCKIVKEYRLEKQPGLNSIWVSYRIEERKDE